MSPASFDVALISFMVLPCMEYDGMIHNYFL